MTWNAGPAQPAPVDDRRSGTNRNVALALGVGSVFAVLILVGQLLLIGQIFNKNSASRSAPTTAGASSATNIQCSPVESLATHYHSALRIHRNGGTDVLPAGTGINAFCLFWIHVHDSSGIVHVEAPAAYRNHTFVLADVFAVAKTRFDANHLGSASFPGRVLTVYVNGEQWRGPPGEVPLVDLDTIDVVAPGQDFTYQPFNWPSGFQPPPTA